jgi:hypothetical protein
MLVAHQKLYPDLASVSPLARFAVLGLFALKYLKVLS